MRLHLLPLLVTAAFVAGPCQGGDRSLAPIALAKAQTVPAGNTGKLVLLRGVESRVEVDAQGHVAGVHSDETLPPALLSVLDQNVRKLVFAPPEKDGHPVPGVTFVRHDVCAAPVDGAYRLAVKYRGNGPSTNIERVFPRYPPEALRLGASATWKVEYEVAPDGTAKLAALTRTDSATRYRDFGFPEAIKYWVAALRFQPEQLDGQPVGTRIATTVEFTLDSKPAAKPDPKAEPTCQIALGGPAPADERVALDSPFKVLNAPAPQSLQ